MRLLADHNIPLLEYYFSGVSEITAVAPEAFSPQLLTEHDLVLIRSTVKVNAELLGSARPTMIASCVSGADHLDLPLLEQLGIPYYLARGCNAQAVAAYVEQVVFGLVTAGQLPKLATAAVIGVGYVGTEVVKLLRAQGHNVFQCDPLRAQQEDDFKHVPLTNLPSCDLVCIHTPLTLGGEFPTFNMIGENFLASQSEHTVILNAGRGEVVDAEAVIASGLPYCFDVWPGEPDVSCQQAMQALLATPHIAGHTQLGKSQGTHMAYQAMAKRFHWPARTLPVECYNNQHGDLFRLSQQFKAALQRQDGPKAEIFKKFRAEYAACA